MTDIVLVFLLTAALAWPLGRYLARIFTFRPTFLDRVLDPIESLLYRLLGVDRGRGMTWLGYAKAILFTNLALGTVAFLVFAFQGSLGLLNPDHLANLPWDLALHTTASFITNTNQQHYAGQAQLSYLSQLLAIVSLQVITPTTGLVALVAILRALRGGARRPGAGDDAAAPSGEAGHRDLGNFYVDITRALLRFTLPAAFVMALLLAWQGVPATFSGAKVAHLVQPTPSMEHQGIPVGPVAAMVAIKQLGTNGGGWYGPNSSVPLENPTQLSNLFETVALILWPVAVAVMTGYVLERRRFAAMMLAVMVVTSAFLVAGAVVNENVPNRAFAGLSEPGPNLEGKEVRFGATATALWGTLTTQTSNGSVNGMLDSFTPLGGLVPIVGMLLNETYGGVGVGVINFLLFVVLAVFLAGLMVGRTPEVFGRKLEAKEVKLAAIALLLQPLMILGFTAVALAVPGLAKDSNPLFHGVSQVLYEYTSASANNGSGFEGLGDATVWWNVSASVCLILGRFIPILAPLALAGSLARKRAAPETAGTLRIDTPTFGVTTFAVIVILTLLGYLPALVLGPIAEQRVASPQLTPLAGAATSPIVATLAPWPVLPGGPAGSRTAGLGAGPGAPTRVQGGKP